MSTGVAAGADAGAGTDGSIDQRLVDIEIKLGYVEDLVDQLNLTVYRQQQQIDALIRQLTSMQQQSRDAGGAALGPQNELPPHY